METDYIECCRYYKGEQSKNNSEFWNLERHWVNTKLQENTADLSEWFSTLISHNLLEWANSVHPEIPITLKGLLLSR